MFSSKRIVFAILFLLIGTPTLVAQRERGTIRGVIRDATGAVVPGVQVMAIHVETGVQSSTISSDAGLYVVTNLHPGVYRIEAELPGFKKLLRENVQVGISEVVGLDLLLEVGEVTETVTVTGASPQLQKESTEVATAIEPRVYQDLPVTASNMRSVEQFISLSPGFSGNTFDAHINGSQTLSKEMQLDGLSVYTAEIPGDPRNYTFPPEAVHELKLATSGWSAEFGNTGGGVVQLTIKSGTNEFHGNVYEYLRNDVLDARGFFRRSREVNRQNEFGGSFGGPFWIPGLYDGRNKTFFFVNLNFFRFQSGALNLLASVPTPAFKNGDLSALRDAEGNLIQLYDPVTHRPDGQGGFIRDPFPNNQIPADRISSISRAIMKFVPDPSRSGIVDNFDAQDTNFRRVEEVTSKVDHELTANHRLSSSFNWGRSSDGGPAAALPPPVENTRDGRSTFVGYRLGYDWTLSPTVVAHLAAGYNQQFQNLGSPGRTHGLNWGDKLGLKGVPNGAFPTIFIFPFTPWGQNQEFFFIHSHTFLYSGNVSWVKGKHNLKLGGEFRKAQNNFLFPSTTGSFNFQRNQTAFPVTAQIARTGNAFASFLLGEVNNSGFRLSEITTGGRWGYAAGYVQDDIKLTPRFTLNAGLRWDLFLPLTEVNDRYSVMDPTVPNPRAGERLGALVFAGDGPFPRTGRSRLTNDISWNNWGPRLGFAWELKEGLVLRAAYGLGYFMTAALGGANVRAVAQGFEASPSFTSLDGLQAVFNWKDGFPQNFDRPPFIDAGFNVGGGISMWNEIAHEPLYRQDFNLALQYQLAPNWLLDLGWVGSKSTRLSSGVFNVNQVDSKFLSLGELLRLPITDARVAAAGFTPPYPGFRGTLAQALRPFSQYTGVGQLNGSLVGNMSYHSLQAKLEKQFSEGLYLLTTYTWSKSLSDASAVFGGFFSTNARDQYNRKLEKALSVFDVPHRVTLAFVYELPIGPGKAFASVGGPIGKLLEGWQINGVGTYESGRPIGVGVNNTLPLFNSRNLPDVVPGVDPIIETSKFDPAKDLMLNSKAFKEPAPFTFGNAASVLPNARNFNFYNENLGIMKRTYINENVNVEFRFEMFNIFNRVIFGGPASNASDSFNFGRVASQANQKREGQFALKINF